MTPAIIRLRATVYRAPIGTPVVTSFGTMRDRPMVLVRVEDGDGAAGWGEIWCNFPTVGAEHRARLVESVLAPLLEGRAFEGPEQAFAFLTRQTDVLALQSAEPGPFAAAIAAVDTALWDLAARRAGVPLFRLLGGTEPRLPAYASGLNPDGAAQLARARWDDGYRAFKLKVGFGTGRDADNLRALRAELPPGTRLMVDANQGWDLPEALAAVRSLEPFDLAWLEEPLRADRPPAEWRTLADATGIPLAAGENLRGDDQFAAFADILRVVQPDLGKWGGITAVLPIARRTVAAGASYCPHWLGGGIGLLASAHLLAAVGGPGMLEVDSNPNPLRSLTCGALATVHEGQVTLADAPGLGPEPDEAALRPFRVPH